MYSNVTPVSAQSFAHASNLRRTWHHQSLKLHILAFGGGSWRVQSTLTGRTLGTIHRTGDVWTTISPSLTFSSTHPYLADAALALAAYSRMASSSQKQLRWAKAIRSDLTYLVAGELCGQEILTFWRFLEFEPRCQISAWWLNHRKVLLKLGWQGFKKILRQDKTTYRFIALYHALTRAQAQGTSPMLVAQSPAAQSTAADEKTHSRL